MEAEDGTGSRRPSWRCGNVTPPIPFDISSEQLRLLTFFIYIPEWGCLRKCIRKAARRNLQGRYRSDPLSFRNRSDQRTVL